MDSIANGLVIFTFLLVIFRVTGNRSLAQITTFDAVLILIIAEAVQEAMIGGDQSMTNALLLVVTLLGFDVLLSILSVRSAFLERLINGAPVLLVSDGEVYDNVMARARVSKDDVMEQARLQFGIERFDQIKHAVLERNGTVTVIPRQVGWAIPPGDAPARRAEQSTA